MIEILGFISAVIIGIVLGLVGGGGSILTVPVLVYLLKIEPVPATAYSLFVVGLTSLIGSVIYMRKGLVDYKTGAVFAVPAFIAVYLTRRIFIPWIPEELISFSFLHVSKDLFIMILFALLMIAAAFSMIKDKTQETIVENVSYNFPLIFIEGFIVGILTGLVGAGGGFLIIPALVLFAKLPMKTAIGTSLLVIAIKSLIGFTGDIGTNLEIDWFLILTFSVFAVVGILSGSYLSKFISGSKLKPIFGWFTLILGVLIISKELYSSY